MFTFTMILRKLKKNKRTPKKCPEKCWYCKHYSPVSDRWGTCSRIKSAVNYRDFRETDVSTEAHNANENGWHISQLRVLGYMVCDLFEQ